MQVKVTVSRVVSLKREDGATPDSPAVWTEEVLSTHGSAKEAGKAAVTAWRKAKMLHPIIVRSEEVEVEI